MNSSRGKEKRQQITYNKMQTQTNIK